ncbi:GntR family transcriptional regulator [Desulfotomaculum nigrificans]|uniref:GntR family transcriptional regulator n=1 Tax=Desulfotomaculum nigrificans TaxID=1565 RepID=UPI0001FADE13|nr:GntR family transcriptional regulator [Desulfotomaculum nigrificans]
MPRINASPTREYVYQLLKSQILDLELKPGTSLSEKEISEKFQVSRTPVREAFLKLSQEGLLEIYPQKGTRVSLIDLALVEDARFMREQLEKAVIKLACENFPEDKLLSLEINLKNQELCTYHQDYKRVFDLDEELHRTIFEGCNKARIWLAMQPMNTHFKRIRVLRLATNYDWGHLLCQHQQIVDAIKRKDPRLGEEIITNHLKLVLIDKEELKKTNPNYFKEAR